MSEITTPTLTPIENNTPTITVETPSLAEPQISEKDAFAMDIADLKKAAFDPAPQPALVAQPQPDPQATPGKPEPFTLTQDGDTVVLKYATGETFKGANEVEVYRKAAENAVRNIEWAKQVKAQYEAFQQNPAKPVQMPSDPLTQDQQAHEVAALRELLLTPEVKAQIVAGAIGMTPEQLQQEWASVKARTDAFAQQTTLLNFQKENSQTFVPTAQNEQAIIKALETMGVQQFPNTQQLKTAWSLALLEGWATPATPASAQPQRPIRPPVMPSMGAPATTGGDDIWTMPLDQLKKTAGLG